MSRVLSPSPGSLTSRNLAPVPCVSLLLLLSPCLVGTCLFTHLNLKTTCLVRPGMCFSCYCFLNAQHVLVLADLIIHLLDVVDVLLFLFPLTFQFVSAWFSAVSIHTYLPGGFLWLLWGLLSSQKRKVGQEEELSSILSCSHRGQITGDG